MPTVKMNQRERIQRSVQVDRNGCWNWSLGKDRIGYGRLKVSMGTREAFRFTSAHRYAYELWRGVIPDGLCVLHRCDNRACCNPEHLFLGTQQDNMRDMHAKNRGPVGYRRDPESCRRNARLPRKRAAIDAAREGGK